MITRIATFAETEAIRSALKFSGKYDSLQLEDLIPQDIIVRTDYCSEEPGFTGNLAWITHGEPHINTILGNYQNAGPWAILAETGD